MTSFQLGTFALILAFQLIGCLTSEKLFAEYPLTWEILENDLSERFLTRLKCGPNRATKRLGKGETKGLMSKVFLIDFDWSNGGDRSKLKGIPTQCALKIISRDDINRYFKIIEKKDNTLSPNTYANWAHDQELFLYGNVSKRGLSSLKFPKYYAGRAFDSTTGWGYMAIEFLENTVVKHIYDKYSDTEIMEVIEQLAMLNGLSLKYNKIFKNIVTSSLFDKIFESSFTQENSLKFLEIPLKEYPNKAKELEKLIQVVSSFENKTRFQEKLEKNCPIKMVTHGDYWPPNFFWQTDKSGESHLKAIADFQFTHFGNPLYDLVKWFFYAFRPNEYKEKRDKFLSFYYETLLKFSDGQKVAWNSYGEFLRQFEIMHVWKTIENAHSMDIIKRQILSEVPASERQSLLEDFDQRYFVMLDESSRIYDLRKDDLL